jgi:hypothetical protein
MLEGSSLLSEGQDHICPALWIFFPTLFIFLCTLAPLEDEEQIRGHSRTYFSLYTRISFWIFRILYNKRR